MSADVVHSCFVPGLSSKLEYLSEQNGQSCDLVEWCNQQVIKLQFTSFRVGYAELKLNGNYY